MGKLLKGISSALAEQANFLIKTVLEFTD